MSANIYPAVNALQLVIDPPNGRDDLIKVLVWYHNTDPYFNPMVGGSGATLVYEGDSSLNILLPNLDPLKTYHIKYALLSYLDYTQVHVSPAYTAQPLGGILSVTLTTSAQVFNYSANGTTPNPSSTIITASTQNITGTVYYEFLINGSQVQAPSTSNSYIYTPTTLYTGMPQQVVVKVRNLPNDTTEQSVLAQDSISLLGIKPGEDGTSVNILGSVATNQNLPGYPSSYTGSTGDGYIVQSTGNLWVWDGQDWIDAGNIKGPKGDPGRRTAVLQLFKVSATEPTDYPEGISYYSWFTGYFSEPTTPNGWSINPPTPALGQILWGIRVVYSDNNTSAQSAIDWANQGEVYPVGASGISGENGTRTAILELYKWSTTVPTTFPVGNSTYTWANGTFTLPPTPNGWSETPGSPTQGQNLYGCTVSYADTNTTTTSIVSWNTSTAYIIGSAGTNATRTAILEVYQVAATAPTQFPVGDSTYTWATGQFTAPSNLNGWSLTPPATAVGQTLWIARTIYTDNDTSSTSTVAWNATIARPVSASGSNGENATRTAILEVYQVAATAPTQFPSGNSTYTWATGQFSAPSNLNGWSLTPPATVIGQTLWVARAIYADNNISSTSTVGWNATVARPVSISGTNGTNAITATLTNDSANLAANSSGTVTNFTPAEGYFKVFSGTTEIPLSAITFTRQSETGIVTSIDSTGKYTVSGMSEDSGTATFRATLSAAYGNAIIDKVFTVTRLKAAINGTNPLIYDIVTSAPVITKESSSAAINGTHSSITIQGKRYDGNTTSNFGWVTVTANDGTVITASHDTSTSAYTLSPDSTAGKTSYTIRLYSDSALTALQDTQTVSVVFKGNTGNAGANAVTAILSNESHVFPANKDGAVTSYTNSGTEIRVYEGTTELLYDGVGTANSSWKITTASSNITVGTINDSGSYATVGQHLGVTDSTDVSSITYTITGTTANSLGFTIVKTQTFTKSKTGATGSSPLIYDIVTSAPVITKESSSAAINGTHSSITIQGKRYDGNTTSNFGWVTVTANDGTVITASHDTSTSAYTLSPDSTAGKTSYTIRLYSDSALTALQDTQTVSVVFKGNTGANGARTAVLELYKWSTNIPTAFPAGTSTYTWATGVFTLPATANDWTLTPGASLPGQILYGCSVTYVDTATTNDSSVTWNTSTAYALGSAGNNGSRTAVLELYKWSTDIPTAFPAGTSTYTWATGVFTLPATANDWALTPGTPTQGQKLYGCSVTYVDTSTTENSQVGWNTLTAYALGMAGTNGNPGVNASWTKYVYVYKLVTRANNSTASVAPATPSGGIFTIDTLQLTTAPDGWSLTQPASTGGTVYVSRNRVAPNNQLTGTITLTSAWSTPIPATQVLQNGASYTYDTEANTSSYSSNFFNNIVIYTKSPLAGTTPTTPSGGSFLIDIVSGNTTTAPSGWFNTIALLDADTNYPAQNPVFQSTTTITTSADILSYTPTWSTPQYQFRTGGQISSSIITRDPLSLNFTNARQWQKVLGSGPQANSASEVAFLPSSSGSLIVAAGSSGSINYSLNGGNFVSVTGAPSTSFRAMAASTTYMVLSSTTTSTIYVNVLSNGLPSSAGWSTVPLTTRIGSGINIYSIIKVPGGWLAVGDNSSGVGVVIASNNSDPRVTTSWSTVSITWGGTGSLPGLRSVASYLTSSGTNLTMAVGINGTIILSIANGVPTTTWYSIYGPGLTTMFSGSDSLAINTVCSHPTPISGAVFSFAFNTPNATTSSPSYTIGFNTSGVPITLSQHPTINDGSIYNTPIKIWDMVYSYTYKKLFAATDQGLFVCKPSVKSLTAITGDSWRQINNGSATAGGSYGAAVGVSDANYVLCSLNSGFSTSLNIYYYLGSPINNELSAAFSRTSAQVGDVVNIQLNLSSSQAAINSNYTFGLRCTAVANTGAGSSSTWSILSSWIDGDMVVDGSITANSLAVNSIIAEKIQAGSITADKLSANTVLVNQSLQVGNPVVTGTIISSGSGAVITGGSSASNNTIAFGNSTSSMVVKDGVINFNGKIIPAKNAAFGVISDAILHDIVGPSGFAFPIMTVANGRTSTKLQFGSYGSTVSSTPTIYVPSSDIDKVFKIHIELNLHVKINVELYAGYIGMRIVRTNITDGGTPPTTIDNLNSDFDSIVSSTKTWSNQLTPWGEWPHNLITTLTHSLIESTTDPTRAFFQPISPGKTYAYTVFLFAQLDNSSDTALYQTVQPSIIVGDSTYIPSQQYYPKYGQLFTTTNAVLPETYFSLDFYGSPTYSNVLTVSGATANTNSLLRGMTVYGPGVPPRTVILNVLNSTQISLYTFTGDNFGNSGGYMPKIPGAIGANKTYYFGPPLVTGLTADNVIVFGNWTLPAYIQPRFSWPKINSAGYGSNITINPVGIFSSTSGSTIQLIGYYTQNIV